MGFTSWLTEFISQIIHLVAIIWELLALYAFFLRVVKVPFHIKLCMVVWYQWIKIKLVLPSGTKGMLLQLTSKQSWLVAQPSSIRCKYTTILVPASMLWIIIEGCMGIFSLSPSPHDTMVQSYKFSQKSNNKIIKTFFQVPMLWILLHRSYL